ncbi:MAG: hypothetical protein IKR36_08190 [Clostridia bacterium]|nr:hypothetical protein [Clostridia bacterium]
MNAFPCICAHRGFKTAAPENTLPAFALAVALGAPEIELDLWPTKDGDLAVCHDPDVSRTTGCPGLVTELTTKELKQLDAGSWFSPLFVGTRIPLFEEVLDLVGGHAVINIHIKSMLSNHPKSERATARNKAAKEALGLGGVLMPPMPAGVEEVYPEIENRPLIPYSERDFGRILHLLDIYGCRDKVYIAGEADVMLTARGMAPDIPRCCLEGHRNYSIVDHAIEYGCQRVQFWKGLTTQAMVDKAKQHGMICNLFWADDPSEARAYIELGIDCVLTNNFQPVQNGLVGIVSI